MGAATAKDEVWSDARIVEDFGDLVFNLAVRLTGDRDQARDLSQDAFIRILKGRSGFRAEASLKTWICQVVINCHRNNRRWWRRLKRAGSVSLDTTASEDARPLADRIADPAPGADRQMEGRESRERLEAELRKLPEEQRLALLLREVEGMSYAEIASAMKIREGTVKSRLARARESLRCALPDLVSHGGGE